VTEDDLTELARREVRGGVVRVLAVGADRILIVRVGARRYTVRWEPRESGPQLLLHTRTWDAPDGGGISCEDWDTVLDALWAVAPQTGGVCQILEWDADASSYQLRRG
jgi:hypothetical protein